MKVDFLPLSLVPAKRYADLEPGELFTSQAVNPTVCMKTKYTDEDGCHLSLSVADGSKSVYHPDEPVIHLFGTLHITPDRQRSTKEYPITGPTGDCGAKGGQ